MEIVQGIFSFHYLENVVVALGNFDGVHLGHQHLISACVRKAREIQGKAVVLTFDPHPMKLLQPERAPRLLLTPQRKAAIISQLGVDFLLLVPFDDHLAQLSPEDFVADMLWGKLHPRYIFVGFNYSFGQGGQGSPLVLANLASRWSTQVQVVEPVKAEDAVVSSTTIREALEKGDIRRAKALLGYWPILEGEVIPGDQRGRQLGFPTANLNVNKEILIPPEGVYATRVNVEGKLYPGIVNIGRRPTFGDDLPNSVEVYIMDFARDIYGQSVVLELIEMLRPEKRFASADDLIAQIQNDVQQARSICASLGN
ncbi:MAG: bifunctional riboflavin kinase/FAD synthetase [Bacillota bacterium]